MGQRWVGELADWSASLRFSAVTVVIVGLVALGAVIVSPMLSTYVQQQRELTELRASVEERRQAVAAAEAERVKWQDPAYVRAQARGRLFYVMPGETQLGIIDDVVIPPESTETTSEALTQRSQNWAVTLLRSTLVPETGSDPTEQVSPTDPPVGSSAEDTTLPPDTPQIEERAE